MIKMPVCDKCIKCDEELPKSGMFAVCSENGCLLHVGECSGVSEPSWKSMSTAAKDKWRCPGCRSYKSKSPKPTCDLTKPADDPSDEMRKLMMNMNAKLNELMSLPKSFEQLEYSVTMMSEKYEVLKQLKSNDRTTKELKKQQDMVTEELAKKDQQIEDLKQAITDMDQYSRNRTIEISGVPVRKEEDLEKVMKLIDDKIGVPEEARVIDVVHRVPTKSKKYPPKIVPQFTSRTSRNLWLANKDHGIKSDLFDKSVAVPKPVYVNEHMTVHYKELLCKERWEASWI